MQPRSNMFPSIMVQPDYPVVDVRNQYSYLNRMRPRDVLGGFSYDMDWKLPRLNQRIRYLDDKENELTDFENRLMVQSQALNQFESMLGCHCNCLGHKSGHQHKTQPMDEYQSEQQQEQQPRPKQQKPKPKQPSKKALSNSAQNFKKNEQRRQKILRKFRKHAYAVYFTIYLKHFASKFTKNRYEFFKNRYLKKDGEKVKEDSFKITKSIEVIDLPFLILFSPELMNGFIHLKVDSLNRVSTKSTSKLIPQNEGDKFIKALNFVNLYLKELEKVILNKKFVDYYGEIIGIGTLNQSFLMDELMIPQEIQFIIFSQKKGFALLQPEAERTLIMTYIFVKHVLFKVLLRLRENKYLEEALVDKFSKYRLETEKIYDFLELAVALLYTLVNSVFLQFLDSYNIKTNYENLKKKFKISPAKVLSAPGCPRELKQVLNYRELIMGVPKINEVMTHLQDDMYVQYVEYLMNQIEGISQRLLHQVRNVNKAVYQHIKQETVKQRFLIFEGMREEGNNIRTMKSAGHFNGNDSKTFHSPNKNMVNSRSNTSLGNHIFKHTKN